MFGLLFAIYFIDNPTERTSYITRYPYVLSFNPGQISQHGSTNISLSSFFDDFNKTSISLKIINPDGDVFKNESNTSLSWIYPDDFKSANSDKLGNYTVAVISKDNTLLISGSFLVLANAFLSSFSNFVFGTGLGITIGVIGTIVTLGYQIVSQHNQDRARRLDDKAKWMIDNTKYYMALYANSTSICYSFKPQRKPNPNYESMNVRNILYYTVQFYSDFEEFKKNCGFYYFDDYETEDFLAQLEDKIFTLMDEMTNDYHQLRQFFALKSHIEFMDHKNYKLYLDRIKLWLSDPRNAEAYYHTHLTYRWILLISVNKALTVTYSSTSKIAKSLELGISSDKDTLISYIQSLNQEFYPADRAFYYSLFTNNGKLRM